MTEPGRDKRVVQCNFRVATAACAAGARAYLLAAHPSFGEVPEGEQFPLLSGAVFSRVDGGAARVVVDKVTFREFL